MIQVPPNPEKYCTLIIARHGESEWNAKGITQGQKQTLLTKKGEEQAMELAKSLKETKVDAVFSSDLIRAQKTAEIVALERKLAVMTTEMIRERNYGDFEGKQLGEYPQEALELIEKFSQLSTEEKWRFRPNEKMETDEEVVNRFTTFLREVSVAYIGKTVLIVTHGGCIRTFLIKLGYLNFDDAEGKKLKNTGYIKVLGDGVDFFVTEEQIF